jgi:predicted lipoprotein with Yx(FWY)xxD motif
MAGKPQRQEVSRLFSFNKFLIPATAGAALLLAACGSSSHSSNTNSPAASTAPATQPAPTQPTPAQPTSSSSSALTVGTATGSVGTYLTGASGRALYIWVADPKGKSNCMGACAKAWPPLTASSMPKVAGGVHAADLSLVTRSDGTKQVAYVGRPLYYFLGDPTKGTTRGQGNNGFGAKWWLVSPAGGPVGATAAAASSSGSSSGAYGSSSSGSYGSSSSGSSGSSSSGSSGGSSGGGWGG